MNTPYSLLNQTATLEIPVITRENGMDVILSYAASSPDIVCRVEEPSGANSLINNQLVGQLFAVGYFPPGTGATKDSKLTITGGSGNGNKYIFTSPLQLVAAQGKLHVASLKRMV